jgi:hypothetical protein
MRAKEILESMMFLTIVDVYIWFVAVSAGRGQAPFDEFIGGLGQFWTVGLIIAFLVRIREVKIMRGNKNGN